MFLNLTDNLNALSVLKKNIVSLSVMHRQCYARIKLALERMVSKLRSRTPLNTPSG